MMKMIIIFILIHLIAIFSVFDYIKKGENTLTFENNSSDKVHATLSNTSYYLFTMSLIEIVIMRS